MTFVNGLSGRVKIFLCRQMDSLFNSIVLFSPNGLLRTLQIKYLNDFDFVRNKRIMDNLLSV